MLEWDLSALFKNEEELEAFTCENIRQAEEFKQKYEKK
ncbi:oligoendopeptidase F family protein, partial [Campylobacter upsaliensis]|nr:oligoendopeptidase F family protein [Campylobacter upsaliensis]